MAQVKRKAPPVSTALASKPTKRTKPTARSSGRAPHYAEKHVTTKRKAIAAPDDRETATDSDPLIESDTTEHSGHNDGVSWPSDDEAADLQVDQESSIINGEDHTDTGIINGEDDDWNGVDEDSHTRATQSNGQATSNLNSTNSREAHAKQKALARERKDSKPHADLLKRAKRIWERLRRQSQVPVDERRKLTAELLDILQGRVKDFAFKHDAGRIIQTGLKYGNKEQRRAIARELQGTFCQLAEGKFAKFTIGKLLMHGDETIRDLVVPEFYGQVRRLIKHPEAAWILDDIYRGAASPTQRAMLLREWYGAEYAIFKDSAGSKPTADLAQILATSSEKRGPTMRYLWSMINQLIQKKTAGFTMLHDAMLQYYLNVPEGSPEATEFIELLKGDEEGDLLRNLAFTASGAQVVARALAYSSAKERKQLLRAFKGVVETMAYDPHAHQVLLAALDVVDDTVLSGKTILTPLLSPSNEGNPHPEDQQGVLLDLCTHQFARSLLLYPFDPNSQSYLSPSALHLLTSTLPPIRSKTSKKDSAVRLAELRRYVAPSLTRLIADRPADLVASVAGCSLASTILLHGLADVDKSAALDAVADLVTTSEGRAAIQAGQPASQRLLKELVQGGHFDRTRQRVIPVEPPLVFADRLWQRIRDEVVAWACGDDIGDPWIVLAMLEADKFESKAQFRESLSCHRGQIAQAAQSHPQPSTADRQPAKKKRNNSDIQTASDADQKIRTRTAKGAQKLLDTLG